MSTDTSDADWKLKLRYGHLKTPYHHYTGIAEGTVGKLKAGFSCPSGSAVMGMKMWATSSDEATDMMQSIGRDIGFEVTGRIQIYDTEPAEPPRENPHGYDILFTPFRSEDAE